MDLRRVVDGNMAFAEQLAQQRSPYIGNLVQCQPARAKFGLNGEQTCRALREIRPLQNVCLLPGASPVVPGVLYYRGELLGVHDLTAFMSLGACAAMKAAPWVLIVEHEGERLGLLADAVIEIRSILSTDVRPLPITLGDRGSCFLGVLEDGLLLLHAPPLFSNPRFFNAF